MSAEISLTPDVATMFALSFAGIVVTLFSHAARAKRIALPLTLLVFHVLDARSPIVEAPVAVGRAHRRTRAEADE